MLGLKTNAKTWLNWLLKEGAAENGDTVVIDFVGSVDSVEFDGSKGENHTLLNLVQVVIRFRRPIGWSKKLVMK